MNLTVKTEGEVGKGSKQAGTVMHGYIPLLEVSVAKMSASSLSEGDWMA